MMRRHNRSASPSGDSLAEPNEQAIIGKHSLVDSISTVPLQRLSHNGTALDRRHSAAVQLAVGKQSLVEQTFGRPSIAGASTNDAIADADVANVATRGVAGAGSSLPHLEPIQRSFGRHDVSGVQAHQGDAAARAAHELGATAYAFGNAVAFAGSPDLHTAAHEAAHVVQQRGGVQLRGGIGRPGDDYERHADQVADAVVARRSAEPLLDGLPAGGGARAVQRKPRAGDAPARESGSPLTATSYFADNQTKFFEAIRSRLASAALPPPHERLAWVNGGAALAGAFERAMIDVNGSGMDLAHQLPALLYPVDPWQVIDLHRDLEAGRPGERVDRQPALGACEWNPIAGKALALEVEASLRRSLPRMGLRYVAQADDYAGQLIPDALVTSHPFDRVVARLVCDPSVVHFSRAQGRGRQAGDAELRRDTASPNAFKNGLRLVIFEWQGGRNPKLWNWVRVTEPRDATAEEVSAAIFERFDGRNHTEQAYALTAAPPFFRVPPGWARKFPSAAEHAPVNEVDDDAEARSALDLADSSFSDEAAGAQAAKPAAKLDIPALQHALNRSETQLRFASDRLVAWNLGHLVGPAMRWVSRHKEKLLSTPDAPLKLWTSVVAAQSTTLAEGLADLIEVTDSASTARVVPGTPEARPFQQVVEALGIAMGESHLAGATAVQLAAAKRLKAVLPLALLERTTRATHDAAQVMSAAGSLPASQTDPTDLAAMARGTTRTLEASGLALREKIVAGGSIEASELDAVAVSASEETLRTRILTLHHKLDLLDGAAEKATDGATGHLGNLFNAEVRNLHRELVAIKPLAWNLLEVMRRESLPQQPTPSDPAQAQAAFARARKQAVANAQTAFAKLGEDHQLNTLFARAFDSISQAQRNTAYFTLAVQIAALIGVSVVGSAAGAMVGGVVRGAMLADAAVDTATFARTATAARWGGAAANIATDAAVQSAVQTTVFGGDTKLTFVENVMTNLMTIGALRPFHSLGAEIGQLDQNARGLWKVVAGSKVVIAGATKLTMEVLVSAGAAYVAARIVHGQRQPSDEVAASWAMQGASMAVGKFVHARTQELTARWAQVGELRVHLLKRARAQQQLAHQLEQTGRTDTALLLLEDHTQLLRDEHALLQNPNAVAQLGLNETQLGVLRTGNEAALADTHSQSFGVMRMRFHGLEPIASNGLVWSGRRAQIEAAIAESGSAVRNVQGTTGGRWTVEIGGRQVTFIEIQPAHQLHGAGAGPGSGPDQASGPHPTRRDTSPVLDPTEEHDLIAKGASPYEMGVLARIVAIDPPNTRRLIRIYEKELLERLATEPFTNHAELEAALVKQRAQVKQRVQGLYESTDNPPEGWQLVDKEKGVTAEPDGTRRLITAVHGPNGAEGYFERAYNPQTKVLELRMAFLKLIGTTKTLPNMVSKQAASPEMVDKKGTPTVQWVTLHQMRRLGVPLGSEGDGHGVETIHLSSIQNVETIVHLHYLKKTIGGELSDLVVHTPTVKYAETTAIQSGYRRIGLPVLLGGQETPIRNLLAFQEGMSPQRRAENNAILAKYGFDRDTVMRWNFNIDFQVGPEL